MGFWDPRPLIMPSRHLTLQLDVPTQQADWEDEMHVESARNVHGLDMSHPECRPIGEDLKLSQLFSVSHRRQVAVLFSPTRTPTSCGVLCGNAVRDAAYRIAAATAFRESDKRCPDVERMAIAVLNRSASDIHSLTMIQDSMASLSVRCALTVVSSVCDAAVRQHEGSQYRQLLRRVLTCLGNCAFIPCMSFPGVQLRTSSVWLLSEMCSNDSSEGYLATVARYFSQDAVQRLANEVVPAFDVDGCLTVVAPRVMRIRGRESYGIRLAKDCLASLMERGVRPPSNISSTFVALLALLRYDARVALRHEEIEDALTTLETLCDWCTSAALREYIWRILAVEGECSHAAFVLWCRGYGPTEFINEWSMATIRRLKVHSESASSDVNSSTSDSVLRLELLILATSSCLASDVNAGLILTETVATRAQRILDLVDEQLKIAGVACGRSRPVLILALARQLPVLCRTENERVASVLFPRVPITLESAKTKEEPELLIAAFRLEILVLSFVLRLQSENLCDTAAGKPIDNAVSRLVRHVCHIVKLYLSNHSGGDEKLDTSNDDHCTVFEALLQVCLTACESSSVAQGSSRGTRNVVVGDAVGLMNLILKTTNKNVLNRIDAFVNRLSDEGRISEAERLLLCVPQPDMKKKY
jgi:hypothetical protein